MPSRLAITTVSLGLCSAGHSLVDKLDALHKYGYHGVEIYSDDLYDAAESLGGVSPETLLAASHRIAALCRTRSLEVVSLQPFRNYEGLVDRAEHVRRLDELHLWFRLAHALGTDLILVPSSMAPAAQVSDDLGLMVADLREAADLAAAAVPPVRLCFESLCWGTRADLWETSWAIVQQVDRPNFGLCLDTFNIAGRLFADPTRADGQNPGDPAHAVTASMARLVADVDVRRVFLVQVVDAARLDSPLNPGHAYFDAAQPSRMSWSRHCRLFYGEPDGYLPVREIAAAIFRGLGYDGWISLELFNKRTADRDPGVPDEMARRGAESWTKLVTDMGLQVSNRARI